MARKKKQPELAKTKRITIRVTDDMYELLQQNAKHAHLSLAEYARQMLLEKSPKVHYEIVFNSREMLNALAGIGRIGNNLNQIAWKLNSGERVTEEMRKEVHRCIVMLHDMRADIQGVIGEYRGAC